MSTANGSVRHHAHHFNDAEHEFQTSKFGIWLFLCTEILMFGGLFVAYLIFHSLYPEMFAAGATFLDWKMGALNTVVLIFSSFTMAMGIYYAQRDNYGLCMTNLTITVICGVIFMIVKYFEYTHKFHAGIFPGQLFNPDTSLPLGQQAAMYWEQFSNLPTYFSLYFLMTGLHGSHVIIGLALIVWVMFRARNREFGPDYYTPIEGVGLFWHLVDLIWIYLFPLLYLIG